MSFPAADPELFTGLFETHVEPHLGAYVLGLPPDVMGYNRGFAVSVHRHSALGLVTAATTGVRFQKRTGDLPQEYSCSALPGQEQEAAYLVHVAADRAVRAGRSDDYGGGYLNAEPLIPDSRIAGLLMTRHPWVDSGFDLFHGGREAPVLRFVTVLPATRAEMDAVGGDADPAAALLRTAADRGIDLRDVYRDSAA